MICWSIPPPYLRAFSNCIFGFPEFTIDYLNGKSFETAKISAPFKITFMHGNPNLFTGQCDDGHYGGGKMEGEWSLAPNNSIIISGSLERHSYQETDKVSVTKLLIIDIDHCNFAENAEDLGSVIQRVNTELYGLF